MERVNFLRENPVLGGMQQAQQMDATRARGELLDMQVEGARERGRQERAASEALNQIWASGGPNLSSADVNRRLAQDPRIGGTRRMEALQTAEDQENKRTQTEAQARERNAREFKMFLETGADTAAAEVAKRMGLNIPPTFWTDQAARRQLLQRLEVEDKQAGVTQKRAAAGASSASAEASRALARSREPAPFDEYDDEAGRKVRVDRGTGQSSYVNAPDGQPLVQGQRRAGAEGRPLNIEARRQMLVDAGLDPQQASLIAAGGTVTPAQRAQISERIRNSVGRMQNNVGMPLTPAEQAAEVQRREAGIFGSAGQPQAQQPQGGPTPERPAQPLPRDARGKVDMTKLVPGEIYLIPRRGAQKFGRWDPAQSDFVEVP